MLPLDPSNRSWFRVALQFRGSVIPAILPRTLASGVFAAIVCLLHLQRFPVALPVLASLIPNVVLGLMLVFRTNTAYERFWEGRKLWGSLNNHIRNLARHIWGSVLEKDLQDRQHKKAALYLLAAFAVSTKLHLRQDPINEELKELLSPPQYSRLKTMNHPPLEVAFWIQDYLQHQYRRHHLHIYQLTQMQQLLNQMVDALGGCERILRTPIPIAYAIHLKQLLLLYCLTLPFQFVKELEWWTVPMVILISFTLFGIEAIGIEIENPFGRDSNDLPLDTICITIKRNLDDLASLEPTSVLSEKLTSPQFLESEPNSELDQTR
mgnify:CR=1 FL=1